MMNSAVAVLTGVIMLAQSAADVGVTRLDIAQVWSGHPVGFALYTRGDQQFVAYYDAERRMTVAARKLDSLEWTRAVLPETVNWDSHNYVTLAIDDDGYLHLSGNMHCRPLVYFRTTKPLDITTFERAAMVGQREDQVTYPDFLPALRGPGGELLFTYRDGRSGSGDQLYNLYDSKTRSWRRLLDTPLTSGGGKMNAYFYGPVMGPDKQYHLCWVWRDTPDCSTNHDISYAHSKDLHHWESASGKPEALPITLDRADIVDPVPVKGGAINGGVKLGFDSKGRPVVSYHKFDAKGNTQIYNARFEDGAWKVYQTSDWTYRWDFSGNGAIISEIHLSGVKAHPDGSLTQHFQHKLYGSGTWRLDEGAFKPLSLAMDEKAPAGRGRVENAYPGMTLQQARDLGRASDGRTYRLEWDTLEENRDRARPGDPPPPSTLRLIAGKE